MPVKLALIFVAVAVELLVTVIVCDGPLNGNDNEGGLMLIDSCVAALTATEASISDVFVPCI